MDNSDKISTITNDNPEDRDKKDVKRYPDSGGYDGGAGWLSSRPMPIAETLENIYTPWSQIGLTQQSLNTIVCKR